MDLDLGLVESFLVLVRERHYGSAAAALHLTSPALSKRIQRLEQQLGVTLVERGPAGVLAITAAGLRFATAAVPLLAGARAAREAAQTEPAASTLRLGFPLGGFSELLQRLNMAGIAQQLRREFPQVRLICRGVQFPALTRCLLERRVDLLWTNATVRHPAVESFPLAVSSARMAVVGPGHRLADAGSVDVADILEEPTLFSSDTPEEWMRPFWFADLRPRRQARLVDIEAIDQAAVWHHAGAGTVLIGTIEPASSLIGPKLRAVSLIGAPPMTFYVARHRTERSGAVDALITLLRALDPDALNMREPRVHPDRRPPVCDGSA